MTDRLAEIRARHADIPQDPLPLDIPESHGMSKGKRTDKSIAQATCPWHVSRGTDQTTGLVRASDGSLIFREHTKRIGKSTVRCPGSGQAPEMKEDSA